MMAERGRCCEILRFTQNDGNVAQNDEERDNENLRNSAKSAGDYLPCAACKQGAASDGKVTPTSAWDTMIVPAVSGNYVSGGEYIYTEGYNGWTASTSEMTDEVNTANCDAIVGYNTGRMDVLFLKSEQTTSN